MIEFPFVLGVKMGRRQHAKHRIASSCGSKAGGKTQKGQGYQPQEALRPNREEKRAKRRQKKEQKKQIKKIRREKVKRKRQKCKERKHRRKERKQKFEADEWAALVEGMENLHVNGP